MPESPIAPGIDARGFDHVDLWVPDLGAAARFFAERLGLERFSENDDHTFFALGDQVLGLRKAPDGQAASHPHHLAIRVAEFDGLRRRVEARGLTVREERQREDSRSLFIEGPNGLSIELIHRPHPEAPQCATNPPSGRS